MNNQNNIVLIGMPGCGKTTIGTKLASFLEYEFVDLDFLISKSENLSITEIFKIKGEEYFRSLETDFLKKLQNKKNMILSTGGGCAQKDENIKILKNTGKIFYLEILPFKIFERIRDDKTRPLLEKDNPKEVLEKLFKKRENNYKKADFIINADRNIEDITDEIIKIYEKTKC